MFSVTGEECGCVSMNVSADTTSVTCSGWTAAGQNCSFGVQTLSQDCEFCSNSVTSAVTLSGMITNKFTICTKIHTSNMYMNKMALSILKCHQPLKT